MIQLTFRPLPTLGETPWMISGQMQTPAPVTHTNPILQKFSTKKDPWFGKKGDNKAALDAAVGSVLDDEAKSQQFLDDWLDGHAELDDFSEV